MTPHKVRIVNVRLKQEFLPKVSMHALLRYAERICGFDVVKARLALSGPAAARGTDFPRFSLSGTCALERTAGARFDAASYRSCLSDERAARRTLRRRWASFPPADRQNCREENEIGGPPSYVALRHLRSVDAV